MAFTCDAFTCDTFTCDAFTCEVFTCDAFTCELFTFDTELAIHLLVLYLYLRCLGLDSKYQVFEQYTNTKAQVNDN